MSTWDAGRDSTPGTWTRVPSTSPARNFLNADGIGTQLGFLPEPNERLQWFFGFPTALVTSRIRHYQWGTVRNLNPDTSASNQEYGQHQYLRPSTEEFYDGAQTQHPLPFVDLSCAGSSCAGITEDGTLWAWGSRTNQTNTNALGLGDNATIAQPFERSTPTSALLHWRTNKFIAATPQPVVGQADVLAGLTFKKCVVTSTALLALASNGNLYACGSASNVFGIGDYYTSGSSGRFVFAYPTLVRFWGLQFVQVGNNVVGQPIQHTARVYTDFACTDDASVIRLIADDGKIYRRIASDAGGTVEDEPTRAGACYRLVLTDPGYGYNTAPIVTVDASPNGDNMAITATIVTGGGLGSNTVVWLNVSNWGSGYTAPPTVTIAEPTNLEKTLYPTWRRATAEVEQTVPTSNTWAKVYAGGFNSEPLVFGIANGRFAIASDGYLYRITSVTSQVTSRSFATFDRLHDTKKFTKAAVGDTFLVALTDDGEVWTMGAANSNGTASARGTLQLLDAGPCVDVAAGPNHGVMVKANGEAWAWGTNTDGQLGNGTKTNSVTPTKVSGTAKWKKVFGSARCTMAVRDEQFDAAGNRIETLPFAG